MLFWRQRNQHDLILRHLSAKKKGLFRNFASLRKNGVIVVSWPNEIGICSQIQCPCFVSLFEVEFMVTCFGV